MQTVFPDQLALAQHLAELHCALGVLIAPGAVAELRAIGVSTRNYRRPHVVSGYFDSDHLQEMAKQALLLTPASKGVYFTINPVRKDLLARRCKPNGRSGRR